MNITEARAACARLKAELESAEKLVAELEREPLRLWVNVTDLGWDMRYSAESSPEKVAPIRCNGTEPLRIAVPMVELRPGWALVKVPTDEELVAAWTSPIERVDFLGLLRSFANALGLRESQS